MSLTGPPPALSLLSQDLMSPAGFTLHSLWFRSPAPQGIVLRGAARPPPSSPKAPTRPHRAPRSCRTPERSPLPPGTPAPARAGIIPFSASLTRPSPRQRPRNPMPAEPREEPRRRTPPKEQLRLCALREHRSSFLREQCPREFTQLSRGRELRRICEARSPVRGNARLRERGRREAHRPSRCSLTAVLSASEKETQVLGSAHAQEPWSGRRQHALPSSLPSASRGSSPQEESQGTLPELSGCKGKSQEGIAAPARRSISKPGHSSLSPGSCASERRALSMAGAGSSRSPATHPERLKRRASPSGKSSTLSQEPSPG